MIVLEWIGYLIERYFIVYFLSLNVSYLLLTLVSLFTITEYMRSESLLSLPGMYSEMMPPVTVIIPAYNEQTNIVETVNSVLQLDYPNLSVIVVNDGSTDNTLEELIGEYKLEQEPLAFQRSIKTQPVKTIYSSTTRKNLHVLDKINGGKADALNAGINAAESPYVCNIDGDSVLERTSLKSLIRPFLMDSRTVAAGGTVRVGNDCIVRDGFLERAQVSNKTLVAFQVVEYLRAFFFGRMGWEPFNSVMIISGAFGMFDRKALVGIGGYQSKNISEDMEVVLKLHKRRVEENRDERISYVPDPVCWTEVPEDLAGLRSQRERWQIGLAQSMKEHGELLFHPKGGWLSWLAFPWMLIFELTGPVVEVAGYLYMFTGLILGFVSWTVFAVFTFLAIGLGMILSISSVVIEELTFHKYEGFRHLPQLFFFSLLENLGYRQINSFWRFFGLVRWLFGSFGWGAIERRGLERVGREEKDEMDQTRSQAG